MNFEFRNVTSHIAKFVMVVLVVGLIFSRNFDVLHCGSDTFGFEFDFAFDLFLWVSVVEFG